MNRSPEFAASGTLGPSDNSTECISFREMSNGNLSLKSPFCKCQHCQYTSFDIHMMFCIPACINIHRNLCRIAVTTSVWVLLRRCMIFTWLFAAYIMTIVDLDHIYPFSNKPFAYSFFYRYVSVRLFGGPSSLTLSSSSAKNGGGQIPIRKQMT